MTQLALFEEPTRARAEADRIDELEWFWKGGVFASEAYYRDLPEHRRVGRTMSRDYYASRAARLATLPVELLVDRVLRGPLAVAEGRLDANDRTALVDNAEGQLEAPSKATAGHGVERDLELDVAVREGARQHGAEDSA